jgi:hypothetical protein
LSRSIKTIKAYHWPVRIISICISVTIHRKNYSYFLLNQMSGSIKQHDIFMLEVYSFGNDGA